MSLKPKKPNSRKTQSTIPHHPRGSVKKIHWTSATDCFTLEYENGFRKVVPKNYRGLSRRQKRKATDNAGIFVPIPK